MEGVSELHSLGPIQLRTYNSGVDNTCRKKMFVLVDKQKYRKDNSNSISMNNR